MKEIKIKLVYFILIILVSNMFSWYITGRYLTEKYFYSSIYAGTIIEKDFSARSNLLSVKFKEINSYNTIVNICPGDEASSKININDSIYKPMFSKTYYIYYRNMKGKYQLKDSILND